MLAILALVVGMSWPALQKPWRKSRLSSAAKILQSELGRARTKAIESGDVLQFRYQPETGRFAVCESMLIGPADEATAAVAGGLGDSDALDVEDAEIKELPAGVVFRDIDVDRESNLSLDESTSQPGDAQPDAENIVPAQLPWSEPITFYPNGRVTGGRFRLLGGDEYYVDVTLRGLTGTAKIGAVLRREDDRGERTDDRGQMSDDRGRKAE